VDLVGGFRARSGRRARMMSMWLRQENRAHLVPLPDPSCKDGLPLVLETGDGTFLVAMGIAPLRALHVMPSETGKGPPVVLAVVQGSKFASRIEEAWLERRRKVETGKHDRIMAGLKSNDRARRREALEQMMEDESSYREKPLAMKSMAAVLEFLKKPVPERARVDAFEILFNINCMHRNDAATVLKNHVDTVLKALGDPNHEVREYAADILWKVPDARVLDALGAALVNDIKHVNMNAIYILELMEDRRAVPYLIEVLKSPSPRARKSAEEALRTITGEEKRNGAEAWLTWWRSRKKR